MTTGELVAYVVIIVAILAMCVVLYLRAPQDLNSPTIDTFFSMTLGSVEKVALLFRLH